MPKAVIPAFWLAEVELEIQNIAFNVSYDEQKIGNRTVRVFKPDFIADGQVVWNPAKKLRGWLKEQVKILKPSAGEAVQYGIKTKGIPSDVIPIGNVSELEGDSNFPEKDKQDYIAPNGLPYPYKETIIVKEKGSIRSTFSFHYVLRKPIKCKVEIFCFARNISPESVKELIEQLGSYTGLGDKHSQGYGHFKLINFTVKQKGNINF
jgi:hypothetical protein